MSAFLVKGMLGLGDNVYQRSIVRALAARADVYLLTPWPELYEDIPRVRFVAVETTLRTQGKNLARQQGRRWAVAPTGTRFLRIEYNSRLDRCKTMLASMAWTASSAPIASMELPAFDPPASVLAAAAGRPVAVVRPATVRAEWANPARNPKPEYLAQAAAALREAGFFVASIADLQDKAEWLVGDPPPADLNLHRGELAVRELLGLVRIAAAVVGGVGWLVPVSVCYRTPCLILGGGAGGWNAPEIVVDPRWMPADQLTWVLPEPYCRCRDNRHACAKDVPDFGGRLEAWVRGLPGARGEAVAGAA
jgi:hypothetical protein